MVSVFLFGVALGDEERGKSASSTARKTDFCGCNSPLSGETRSDCPLNESESRPRAPTTKFKPCWAGVVLACPLCDCAFAGHIGLKMPKTKSTKKPGRKNLS